MRELFHEAGRPFRLLVITDLSQALREEERRAWRRLIRVIWHELNNSLAPIKSVIETSRDALAAGAPPQAEREELAQNLALVAERAESLRRFLSRYSELARMPEPTLATATPRPSSCRSPPCNQPAACNSRRPRASRSSATPTRSSRRSSISSATRSRRHPRARRRSNCAHPG